MLKCKSNCICNKILFCYALKPNIRKQKNKLHSNVKMQTMLKKRSISMEIYCPWMISESWYLDIASISLTRLHLLDSNLQFWTPHATFKGLAQAILLAWIVSTKFSSFSRCAHALCGMNPTPHVKIPMIPNKISKAKCTNKGRLTYSICCAWAWSSSHSNFVFCFLFHSIKSLLFILLLPCMWVVQNSNVHSTVILLPWSPNTNRRTARFAYLHVKLVFVVQMLTK